MKLVAPIAALALVCACDDAKKPAPLAADPSPPTAPSPIATVSAVPPSPPPSAPQLTQSAELPRSRAAPPVAPAPTPAPAPHPVFTHAAVDHATIDASNPGNCHAGSECAVAIRITATDGFHVNPDYVHKLIANPTPGVSFIGGNTFSSRTGAFALAGPAAGVLTVRFRADAPGVVAFSGTVKTGVCTDSKCVTPEAAIAMSIPVD